MISFLIGFMLLPALVGIVLVITWAVEYFKYLSSLLRAHYQAKAARYAQKRESKSLKNVDTITSENIEDNKEIESIDKDINA